IDIVGQEKEFDDIDSYGELKEIIAAEKYLLNNRQQKNKVISQQKLNKGFKHESNMAFHGNKQQTVERARFKN
ncbi:2492_t:CDS:2, partial [Funneliformis geosporum]